MGSRVNEVSSAIPPQKLFKIFLLDSHITIPKILPQTIKSIDIIEGDGGPGSIVQTNFVEGSDYKYVKNKVEVVDTEKLIYHYSTIGGDPWMEGLDKISYEVQIEAHGDGGSICKSTIKYFPIGDAKIDMDQIKVGEDQAMAMFKVVESHILANPDAY
ncbi:major allergen Pru ar 1-like [Euphorbia lathyris]|uniref:major allergen Pru ar 1-like n=1 Tax=Euphorbia lathyris TaxID=212925 RepID=UPI0033141E3E